MKKLFKSKRLNSVSLVLICNFLIFLYGLYKGADLQALGTGLAMLNAPLYVYLASETYRPSGILKKGDEQKQLLVD